MPLVSYSIPHLSNGVSQQPDALRLPTSCEEMVNGWPSLVTGLSKRPPAEHIKKLQITVDKQCAGHLINRSTEKQYFVLVSDKDIDIVDEDGVSQAVSYPDGKAYLDVASNPAKAIRFLTVGDYTFIVNKEKIVKEYKHGERGPTFEINVDYEFDKFSQFPTTGQANKIYFAVNRSKYYVWQRTEDLPEKKKWLTQSTSKVTTQTEAVPDDTVDGYVYASTLPNAGSALANAKRFTATGKTKKEKWQVTQKMQEGQWVTIRRFVGYEYEWTLTFYKCVVMQEAVPGPFKYVEYNPKNDQTEVSRKNPNKYASVYITASAANSWYSVYLNGNKVADFLTGNGTEAAESVEDTTEIAIALKNELVSNGVDASVVGSTISIKNLASTDDVVVKGPNGDRGIRAYRGTIKSFDDLPPNEVEGRLLKVISDPDTEGDDYYVVYRNGVWIEEEGYNEGVTFRASTMPHVLVRELNDSGQSVWVFREHTWSSRKVGDEESNKPPSFVGRNINDIFVFGSRLGFLSDENVILSEANSFENFYRTSCAVLLESDRIDVALFNKDVDILNHAIPFNKDLVLMSANSQYRMLFDGYVSPKTISVQYTTSYNNSPSIKPVNMGTSIYFIDDSKQNRFAKVFEYYPRPNNSGDEAEDVTSAIPEYIPAAMRYMAASPRMNALVTGGGDNKLYVYKFFWDGDRKIQNAWGTWVFPDCDVIYSVWFLHNYLYMVTKRGSDINLERIRFDEDVFTSARLFTAYLDRLVLDNKVTMTYNAATNRTTVRLPYITTIKPEVVSSTSVIPANRHTVLSYSTVSGSTEAVVSGDLTDIAVKVGVPYLFEYKFSKQYLRSPSSKGGERPILEGRVQLRYLSLEYHDTAYFQFHTKVTGRDMVTATYNGDVVGGDNNLIGQVNFGTGVQRIPLMASTGDVTLTITNDSPFGNAFGSAEWQAVWTPRSQRFNS